MGEAKRKRSATQRFIEEFPECCMCGGERRAVTREHMPPKALFDSSHRPDKLVMPACDECNRGTSTADLVASVIARWRYPSNAQELEDHHRLLIQVRRQAPEIVEEWSGAIDKTQARKHLEEQGVPVPSDAGFATIGPLTIRQLNLFAHKVVLCLYFEHFRTLLPQAGRVSAYWRTKEDFAKEGVPKVLLDMMKKYGTLEQGKWNASEIFEYRYEVNKKDGLMMCLARLRGGLFVVGFAAPKADALDSSAGDWIKPSDLLAMLNNSAFEIRN